MKFIKKFNFHSDYESYISSNDRLLPNLSYCEDQNDVHFIPYTYAEEYLTFVAREDGAFTFTPQNNNVISYSTDNGETWTTGNSVNVTTGDEVLWKGEMTPNSNGIGIFSSSADFDAKGNVMSLLYGDNYKDQTNLTGYNSAFYNLFYQNTKIINAKNLSLPATTLTENCYSFMFRDCTSLTNAPELPATTLTDQCYQNMFRGCTSLTTAPELPATTLTTQCYYYMFYGCTSLITAPELPATTLANQCYHCMFYGCTRLTTAPELLATTLADYCYQSMFMGCTGLTTAPELPATTLKSGCYSYMFDGCTSLNYIKAMFTTTPSSTYTGYWVRSVAASGTFIKNSVAEWNVTGVNGVPSGWTIETASA